MRRIPLLVAALITAGVACDSQSTSVAPTIQHGPLEGTWGGSFAVPGTGTTETVGFQLMSDTGSVYTGAGIITPSVTGAGTFTPFDVRLQSFGDSVSILFNGSGGADVLFNGHVSGSSMTGNLSGGIVSAIVFQKQ